MNDLFRAIFGYSSTDQHANDNSRVNDKPPHDRFSNLNRTRGGDDDDDDETVDETNRMEQRGGFFGFPIFNDSFDIQGNFERIFDEMNKAFGMFGFSDGPRITWEGESSNMSSFFNEEPKPKQSLRDFYLKQPECFCERNNAGSENVNTHVSESDIQSDPSNSRVLELQFSNPKVYSKSVYIQTIRRPDGSVETIKKVRDQSGNEETTITKSGGSEPILDLLPPQSEPPVSADDTPGISIFKKFFPF